MHSITKYNLTCKNVAIAGSSDGWLIWVGAEVPPIPSSGISSRFEEVLWLYIVTTLTNNAYKTFTLCFAGGPCSYVLWAGTDGQPLWEVIGIFTKTANGKQ